MPAVLVEVGFLTNAEDEVLLTNPDGQTALIDALVGAIADVRRGFAVGDGRHRP